MNEQTDKQTNNHEDKQFGQQIQQIIRQNIISTDHNMQMTKFDLQIKSEIEIM